MECVRCGGAGAHRQKMRFPSGASVIVFLCEDCAETAIRNEEAEALILSPNR